MFLLGWEKGFKERRGVCLYRSRLLLLIGGLRANACKISVSGIISLAFSTTKIAFSNSLNRRVQKAAWLLHLEWWCSPSCVHGMLTVGTCRGREGSAQSHDIACLAGVSSVSRETNCSLFWVNEVGCYCKWPHEEVHASVDKHRSAYWDPECL